MPEAASDNNAEDEGIGCARCHAGRSFGVKRTSSSAAPRSCRGSLRTRWRLEIWACAGCGHVVFSVPE
jgi:hypothetical protein